MEFKKNDQTIYIKDLLFAVLKQWRRAFAVALIFALVFGVYKGYSQLKIKNTQQFSTSGESAEQVAMKKSQLENEILQLELNLTSQKNYMEKALFMQLNPYEVYSAYAILYVKTPYQIMPGMVYQDPDNLPYIISAILNDLRSEDTVQKVAQIIGYDNFMELLDIYSDGNFLVVKVYQADEEAATALLNALLEQLPQSSALAQETVGEHSYTLTSMSCSKDFSADLLAKQEDQKQRLDNLEAQLIEAKAELAALPVSTTVTPITNATICKSVLLFAVVGVIGGFLLVAFFVCLYHVTGSKVYSVRMLEQMTGIGVLGAFPTKKKPYKGLDRLLRKWENRSLDASATVTATIVANLRNYCPTGSKLLIAGACDRIDMDYISQLLADAGYVVLSAGNLREDPSAVSALPQCDSVLLAEACDVSLYQEVERSAILVRSLGKPVAGCILIDG